MPKQASTRKNIEENIARPIVGLMAKTGLTPNAVTWTGFVVTVIAGVLIITEHLLAAGIVVLVAGVFDMLDGTLARMTGKTSRFGAILDSTLDRVSEALLLLCLLIIFVQDGKTTESILAGVAIPGSLLVSYVRARMEGLGIECKAGLFTRPERVIALVLGLLLSQFNYVLLIALSIIIVFSYYTVIERMVYAWRHLK